MIRAHFGLDQHPFGADDVELLDHQREVFDTLFVHCQQGGLCVVVGEPGTGKSAIKHALCRYEEKRLLTPVVNRTLHTYHSTLRILCEAFQIDTAGRDFRCEKRLIEEAQKINHKGQMLAPIIDDAHLMELDSLRRLRLLFEDFPKNHNLILVAQPSLLQTRSLSVNDDIKSRVTYSVLLPRLAPDDVERFIKRELDKVALAHRPSATTRAASSCARAKASCAAPATCASPRSSNASETAREPSAFNRSTACSCSPTGAKSTTSAEPVMRHLSLPAYEPRFPAPERAVLTLLRAALVVAEQTLRDEHPVLDAADLDEHHAPAVVVAAKCIVDRAAVLRELLDLYDDAVDAVLAHDDEVPF